MLWIFLLVVILKGFGSTDEQDFRFDGAPCEHGTHLTGEACAYLSERAPDTLEEVLHRSFSHGVAPLLGAEERLHLVSAQAIMGVESQMNSIEGLGQGMRGSVHGIDGLSKKQHHRNWASKWQETLSKEFVKVLIL